jgi:tRNA-dihydrouridine synthase B
MSSNTFQSLSATSTEYPTHYFVRDIRIEPCVVLAPMEGITNIIFRRLLRQIGGTGLTYTEFIASSALANRGKKVLRLAKFDPDEKPIAIQIFGKDPNEMAEAAKVIQDLGASILDINMGCPSKRVCAHSGGSALMKDPKLAIEIVQAVRKAIDIPLTVKMRSGFGAAQRNAPELAYACQEEGAEAITIHWRTREDKYGGIRAVDKIAEAKDKLQIPVIGNGDITDIDSAKQMLDETGCDGIMIGRGAVRNPWCMKEISHFLMNQDYTYPTPEEKRDLLLLFLDTYYEQLQNQRATLGKFKQIAKYFVETLPNAQEFRTKLLRCQNIEDAAACIRLFFSERIE